MAMKTPETSTTLSAPMHVFRTRSPVSLFSPSVLADLLPTPDGEPQPGRIHYEVVDPKLAQ